MPDFQFSTTVRNGFPVIVNAFIVRDIEFNELYVDDLELLTTRKSSANFIKLSKSEVIDLQNLAISEYYKLQH